MIKHRLMLSAAAAALLTAALTVSSAVRADTDITNATSTALTTATSGNITIETGGSVSITQTNVPAITLNSANSVTNSGSISNSNVDGGIGVMIDTTAGSLVSASGFTSAGAIDVGQNGTGKRGIVIQGGNTFYGPITLTSVAAVSSLTGQVAATQSSSLVLKGDSSAAFLLVQGTTVTSNIFLSGGGIVQTGSTDNSTQQSGSIVVDLDGTLRGNLIVQSPITGVGPGIIGLQTLGGIHSCASDPNLPSGFTCPSSSGGSLVNAGTVSVLGTTLFNTRGGNPEAGSALVIGGSIDGGFLNTGPGTSNSATSASLSASGITLGGGSQPVVIIDPNKSITGNLTSPRGPIFVGPVTADVDPIDPGYSFINRGTISGQPTDADRGTTGIVIQGASLANFTCLGSSLTTSSANPCDITPHLHTPQSVTTTVNGTTTTHTVNVDNVGGFLNTGTISVQAFTNSQTVTSNGTTTATALYIGAYATVSRIDVKAEAISAGAFTPATINASVSGIGQGSAFGIVLGPNSNVPLINISQNAKVVATVSTNTIAPSKSIATSSSPFTLVSEAIVDQGGSLKAINNAGVIQASASALIPETGAVTITVTNAIDLRASGAAAGAALGGTTFNNSGRILGNVFMNAAGNGDILNVGNTGTTGPGTANDATGVINTPSNYAIVAEGIIAQPTGLAPITNAALIDFGSGNGHKLHVGGFGYVNAVINSGASAVAVQVDSNGQLFVANTGAPLNASTFNVGANGTLGLAISQGNLNNLNPVVQANSADLSGATLALQFGTYISSGFTAASTSSPSVQTVTLIRAGTITDSTLATQNALLGQNTPFLFETPSESGVVPLIIGTSGSEQVLQLQLKPRSTNAKNADGSPGLNLSGDAKNQFPFTAAALATDDELGAAVATSMTVYNTPGVPGSGINVTASQQQAERVFSEFSPDVSGGARDIAIMLTDQATGPVAARQRLLRSYGNVAGDTTLWGQEFTGQINNKGRVSGSGTLTAYKDHGFGFVLGADGGSPRNGWYGGAFTFYSGDIVQDQPRATRTNTQWYMLSGYTDWRGKRAFLDTQISAAYGDFSETRSLNVGSITRVATSRRAGAMLAMGGNLGTMLKYKGFEIDPHVSLDGMTMREEGYQEANGGPGFNLDVAPYFASSLRTALGADLKTKITLWGFDLTPEARLGYRYDLLQDPVKIKAAFESTGGRATAGNTLTFVGPDPDSGNAIFGLSLGASTDTWHVGVSYDWVRGNNGSTTQIGLISVLGRI